MRKSPRKNLDVGENYPYIADKSQIQDITELLDQYYDVKSDAQVDAKNNFL